MAFNHSATAVELTPLEQAQLANARGQDAAALAQLWQHIPALSGEDRTAAILLAAEVCERNGLAELARSYYLHLLKPNPTPLASGDRLAAARFFANHQEWERLENTLTPDWRDFPYLLKSDAFNLLALADLAQQQPTKVLSNFDAERRSLKTNHRYLRFNHAIALYRAGKAFEARQQLQQLLKQPVFTTEDKNLRDEIRIRLASHYLHFQQGKLARPLLDPIKQDSRYATRALLLSGWAELTPDASLPQCNHAKSGQVCWIETDATGHDIQRSPSSISQTFASLRQQLQNTDQPAEHATALIAAVNNSIRRWQFAMAERPSQLIGAEQQARLEAMVSLAYAQQVLKQYPAAKQSYKRALAAIKAHQQAPDNASIQQQATWLQRLQMLEHALTDLVTLPEALQAQVVQAINQAKHYRQTDLQRLRSQQQQSWQQALTEYKKQAHLGLASASHQLSFQ